MGDRAKLQVLGCIDAKLTLLSIDEEALSMSRDDLLAQLLNPGKQGPELRTPDPAAEFLELSALQQGNTASRCHSIHAVRFVDGGAAPAF